MKIALNIYKYLPTKGGGEGYLANFANQLAERGHEVHIYASKWESDNNKIRYHTIPSIRAINLWQGMIMTLYTLSEGHWE